jgi:RNA polymerase sigma factor (sigma-70 family)
MTAEPGKPEQGVADIFNREKTRPIQAVRRRLFGVSLADAEDLVQDVFYNILRRGDLVEQVENLTAYVYRALANRITDHRRAPSRERSLEESSEGKDDLLRRALEPVDPELDPEERLQRKQVREEIRLALDQLNPRDRDIWIATEIEGRTFKELAEEWQEPIGTLLSRKSRAGKLLRALLAARREH